MKRPHLVRRGNTHQTLPAEVESPSAIKKTKYRRSRIFSSFGSHLGMKVLAALSILVTSIMLLSYCSTPLIERYYYYKNNNGAGEKEMTMNKAVTESEVGFAACLLLKDDNHRLIEWIAYHYQVLPLRSLIVALDPNSATAPLSILQRWNTTNNLLPYSLQTILWTDDEYMSNATQLMMEYKSQCHAQNGAELLGVTHRKRQNVFQSACAQHHKRQNRTWVVFIDSDEFITFNRLNEADKRQHGASNNQLHSLRQNLPSIQDTTIWDYMHRLPTATTTRDKNNSDVVESYIMMPPWEANVCLGMARVLFLSTEEKNQTKLYEGVPSSSLTRGNNQQSSFSVTLLGDPTRFDTLRFFYYRFAHSSLEQYQWGKTLVDVSRISFADLAFTSFGAKVRVNAHRPFLVCDPSVKSVEYAESLLRVHHYLGSWDAYSARSDARRGREIFDERNSNPANTAELSYDAQPWLKAFVASVGESAATKLLRGTGGEYGYGKRYEEPNTPSLTFSCALLFYGHVPKTPYTSFLISSIQTNILDINPSCDVYVHTYEAGTMSEEMLFPVIKANPAQLDVNNFVVDSAASLSAMYPEYLIDATQPVSSIVSKWHSMQMVFKCMTQAEETLGRPYDIIGMFSLDARYIRRIHLNQNGMLNAFVISKQQNDTSFDVLSHVLNSRAVHGPRQVIKSWATDRFAVAKALFVDRAKQKRNYPESYISKNMNSFSKHFFHVNNISINVMEDMCVHSVTYDGHLSIGDCRCRELHAYMKEIGKEDERVRNKLSLT